MHNELGCAWEATNNVEQSHHEKLTYVVQSHALPRPSKPAGGTPFAVARFKAC